MLRENTRETGEDDKERRRWLQEWRWVLETEPIGEEKGRGGGSRDKFT